MADLDAAYDRWAAHVGGHPGCDRRCEERRELAAAWQEAWAVLHPPGRSPAWGRCVDCGERTPLVREGVWACVTCGGRPVP